MVIKEFKVGDKVKRIFEGPYEIKKGSIYTIDGIDDNWLSIKELKVKDIRYPFTNTGFELSTERSNYKFKVGDKIVGNDDDRYTTSKKGNGYGIIRQLNESSKDSIDVDWFNDEGRKISSYWVDPKYFDLSEPQEGFKAGDRVIKHKRYSKGSYCRFGGPESKVPLGTKGIIKSVCSDQSVVVKFDTLSYTWNVDKSELILDPETKTENIFITADDLTKSKEETKMEEPKTTLEKNACKQAREEVIKKRTEEKQKQYEMEMNSFIRYERDARDYRKRADEKRKLLGVTDAEMKELF